ncbi:MAG: hypothetical protein O2964_14640 [Verrucomicrobia bacterium]|nr:hypothetical protein [Verrucomicrobiota bacterium]
MKTTIELPDMLLRQKQVRIPAIIHKGYLRNFYNNFRRPFRVSQVLSAWLFLLRLLECGEHHRSGYGACTQAVSNIEWFEHPLEVLPLLVMECSLHEETTTFPWRIQSCVEPQHSKKFRQSRVGLKY